MVFSDRRVARVQQQQKDCRVHKQHPFSPILVTNLFLGGASFGTWSLVQPEQLPHRNG